MDAASPHTLDWLIGWTSQHPAWSGLTIFAIAMLESLVLVGVIVPGAAMMIGAGTLIALGALDLWSSLAWAIAGAITGDGISFWLGYRYRHSLRRLWPFSRFGSLMDRGEDFFRRHGGKSIAFGRFVGPVRAIIPTVAGMMAMSPPRFVVINVLSAIAWAPAYILPGVVFGASLKLASEVALRLVVLVLLLVALLLATRWLVRRVFAFLQPRTEAIIARVQVWSRNHPRLGDIGAALIDPRHPESRALFLLAGILLVAGIASSGIIWNVIGKAEPTGFDSMIYNLMQSLRTPWTDSLMVAVTMLGDAVVYVPVTVLVMAWLLWRRNLPAAIHLLAAAGFGAILIRVLKITLHVPRPTELYTGASAFSFPSGHATMSMVTYGFLAVLITRELPPQRRRLVYVVAGLLIISIAVSRLYLGAHWFTDVAGGLTLGLAWVALLGIAYRRHASPPLPVTWFIITVCSTILLVAGVHIDRDHRRELQRYALHHPVRSMSAAAWWQREWEQLPVYRDDLRRSSEQPFNLQWAGSPDALLQHLRSRGWRRPVALSAGSILQWLNPKPQLTKLPVLPQVHDARHETLLLTHAADTPDRQWVLRLWPADIRLAHTGAALWLGSVSSQHLTRTLGAFAYPSTGRNFDSPLAELQHDLNGLRWRIVSRELRNKPAAMQWSGRVLLIKEPGIKTGPARSSHQDSAFWPKRAVRLMRNQGQEPIELKGSAALRAFRISAPAAAADRPTAAEAVCAAG